MVHVPLNGSEQTLTGPVPGAVPAKFAFQLACVTVAGMCIARMPGVPSDVSMGMLLLLVGFPIWFLAAAARLPDFFDPDSQMIIVAVTSTVFFLMFWSLIVSVDAANPLRSGRTLMSMVSAFSVLLFVVGTLTEARIIRLIGVLVTLLALSALISAGSAFNGGLRDFMYLGTDRAHGFFKNPNQFGMILAMTLPISLSMVFARQARGLWIIGTCLLVVGLVLAGSKSNLLLSAVTTLAFFLLYSFVAFSGPKRYVVALIGLASTLLLIAAGIAALSIFNPRALTLLTVLFSDNADVPSLLSRGHLWRDSVTIFLDNPLSGEGAGQPLEVWLDGETISHSHNVFLEYARTLGAPGVIAIAIIYLAAGLLFLRSIFVALFLRSAHPGRRNFLVGLSLGGLSYMAANMASDSFGPTTAPFFWLVLFVCAAMCSSVVREGRAGRRD